MKHKTMMKISCLVAFALSACGSSSSNEETSQSMSTRNWDEETLPTRKLRRFLTEEKNNKWILDTTVYHGNYGGGKATRTITYSMHATSSSFYFYATDYCDHFEYMYSDPQHPFNKYSSYTFRLGNVAGGSWRIDMKNTYKGYSVYVYPDGTKLLDDGAISAESYSISTDNLTYLKLYGITAESNAEMAIWHITMASRAYAKAAAELGLPALE